MNYEWCKNPDQGIILPDLIFYLDISANELSKRKDFGKERYEKTDFQQKVSIFFKQIFKELLKKNNDNIFMLNIQDSSVSKIQKKIITTIEKKFPDFKTNSTIKKIDW